MTPRLKICGLMRPEDIRLCCRVGVDICGFVTEYPLDVPWNLTRTQCAELLRVVTPPTKRCIVTGGSREKILDLALELRPDLVQLHYQETAEDAAYLVQALAPYGIAVIKTVSPGDDIASLCSTGVYALLVDARGPANAAAGGTADLAFYRLVRSAATCPVMLAGGISAGNIQSIINAAAPDLIDVMTGVERSPGMKSEQEIVRLAAAFVDSPG